MQDNYSDQPSLVTSDPRERKDDKFTGLEDENTASETVVSEMKFRGVMSQYEMEILTTWFPKCAQTLSDVLRNRPRRLGDEL
jgi:hypothetical protein